MTEITLHSEPFVVETKIHKIEKNVYSRITSNDFRRLSAIKNTIVSQPVRARVFADEPPSANEKFLSSCHRNLTLIG